MQRVRHSITANDLECLVEALSDVIEDLSAHWLAAFVRF
jgi:hypothetical protein